MSKIQYMRECLVLSKTLSFARTAEALYIAQPALSRHISALEKEMGAKLFVRDTRNVEITEAGKRACSAFEEILRLYDGTRLEISDSYVGSLSISTPYYWTQDFTEPLVRKIRARYPECEVKLLACLPEEGYVDMLEGKSDVSLCFDLGDCADDAAVGKVPFGFDRLCAFIDVSSDLANRELLALGDLSDQKFVTLGATSMPQVTESFRKTLMEAGLQNPDLLVLPIDEIDSVGLVIHETGRIGFMTQAIAHLNRSYLKCIPLPGTKYEVPLCLYFRRDNPNPLIAQLDELAAPDAASS